MAGAWVHRPSSNFSKRTNNVLLGLPLGKRNNHSSKNGSSETGLLLQVFDLFRFDNSGMKFGWRIYWIFWLSKLLRQSTAFVHPRTFFISNSLPKQQSDSSRCFALSQKKRVDLGLGFLRNSTERIQQPLCRIVTRADAKIPTGRSYLPSNLFQSPSVLEKLDSYYNAKVHKRNRSLKYLRPDQAIDKTSMEVEEADDKELVETLRDSLEDAGFSLLSRRDIDLCDSLNVGYLLRLSIVPDTSELDPCISREFYPEQFFANGTAIDKDELLFDGRVMVFWRGYSQEVTQGRLILPKLDYLQASLVQRSAAAVKRQLDKVENRVASNVIRQSQKIQQQIRSIVNSLADSLPIKAIAETLRRLFDGDGTDMETIILPPEEGSFKLGRYVGSKVRFVGSSDASDALDPFMICEIQYDEKGKMVSPSNATDQLIAYTEHHMVDEVNHDGFTCDYDQRMPGQAVNPSTNRMELLERVSISNLVDLFTQSGRRKLIQAIFETSELVEPTYQEVCESLP